jgi:hypothetical protein
MHGSLILQDILSSLFVFTSVVVSFIVARRFSSPTAVSEKEIIQRWGCLLPDQSELRYEWINRVEKRIEEKKFPFATCRERIYNIYFPGSCSHDFLVVRLDYYVCYIGCITVGTDLYVNWALRRKRSPLRQFVLRLYGNNDFAKTNMVNAFAATIFEVTKETAEDMRFEHFVKKSRVKRKMSGKLGPL